MRTTATTHRTPLRGIAIILSVLTISLIAACSPPIGAPAPTAGTATLVLDLGGSGDSSRTIGPQALSPETIDHFTLTLSGPATTTLTNLHGSSQSIEGLAPGTYAINVSAYDSSNNLIGQGSIPTATLVTGHNPLAITILPLLTGQLGTIDVNFTWPPALADGLSTTPAKNPSMINYITMTQQNLVEGIDYTFSADAGKLILNTTVPSGTYLFSFTLKKGTEDQAPWMEIINVSDYRTSRATINLSAADLTSPPAAPNNLRIDNVDDIGYYRLRIVSDTSSTAQEYQYSDNGGSTWNTANTNAPLSYYVPEATPKTYLFRAWNRFGYSQAVPYTVVPLTGLTLSVATTTIYRNQGSQLTVTCTPSNASVSQYAPAFTINSSTGAANGYVNSPSGTGTLSGYYSGNSGGASQLSANALGITSSQVSVTVIQFTGGSGTAADPYWVTNTDDLNAISNPGFLDKHYIQKDHIVGGPFVAIGTPSTPFTGSFVSDTSSGWQYKFTMVNFDANASGHAGLFGVTSGATIRNLTFERCNYTLTLSNTSAGLAAGFATNTVISGCRVLGGSMNVSSALTDTVAGALVGTMEGGSVTDCGTYISPSPLPGQLPTFPTSNASIAGGLVGKVSGDKSTLIERSMAKTIVRGGVTGGLVGAVQPAAFGSLTIKSSFVSGEVNQGADVSGGLIGRYVGVSNAGATVVQDCAVNAFVANSALYPAGSVIGLVDLTAGGSFNLNRIYTVATFNSLSNFKAVIGNLITGSGSLAYSNVFYQTGMTADPAGTARSIGTMVNAASYTGYSISSDPAGTSTWLIRDGVSFPFLRWQVAYGLPIPYPKKPWIYFRFNNSSVGEGFLEPTAGTPLPVSFLPTAAFDNALFVEGFSASLDGTTQYLEFAGSGDSLPSEYTLTFWVRPQADMSNRPLFSNQDGSALASGLSIHIDSMGMLALRIADGNTQVSTPLVSAPIGSWIHVGLVRDNQGLRLYYKYTGGIFAGSISLPESLNYQKTGPFAIGSFNDTGHSSKFQGQIDEFRVYNRVLTDEEVAALL